MKKADTIDAINLALTDNPDIDFDVVPEDTDMKAKELTDLLSDINDAVAEAKKPPVVKIADVCRELKVDPKTVRARLRRLYAGDDADALPQPLTDSGQRWTFAEDDREAVKALVANAE
jgi:hypothetical protein